MKKVIIACLIYTIKTSSIDIGSYAEWDKAEKILVHTPYRELFSGVIHTEAALYDYYFNPDEAEKEHIQFINTLKQQNIEVYNLFDILAKDRDQMEKLAMKSLTYIPDNQNLKNLTIKKLPDEMLKDIILHQYTVHISDTDLNTGKEAKYEIKPNSNLLFLRDQSITTCKGVVLSKMNSSQRENEVDIIETAYKILAVNILYKIQGEGRMEGGDYIPAQNIGFIGQGLRTNEEGIKQLLSNNVFCEDRVVVVKDRYKNQDQMHLDTFFNILADKTALLIESRINVDYNNIMSLHADIYKQSNNSYYLERKDIDFYRYLIDELGYDVISVTKEDQLKYGINCLTIESYSAICVDGVSSEYKQKLKSKGIKVNYIDFSNLTGAYGAAHCLTQVIKRQKNFKSDL